MSAPSFAFPVRLSEKYRPRKVAEFVGLDKAKRVLSSLQRIPTPCSWLFVGPPGVGKTWMAQAHGRRDGRGVPSSRLAEVQQRGPGAGLPRCASTSR